MEQIESPECRGMFEGFENLCARGYGKFVIGLRVTAERQYQ